MSRPPTASRPLSSLVSSTHAPKCGCPRCAPRSSSVSSIPAPSRPSFPSSSTIRSLSSLAPNDAAHPRACGCARCAPRVASISSAPARPRALIGAGAVTEAKRGMKVRSSIKVYCDGCSVTRRKGVLYVLCSKNPKHKQRPTQQYVDRIEPVETSSGQASPKQEKTVGGSSTISPVRPTPLSLPTTTTSSSPPSSSTTSPPHPSTEPRVPSSPLRGAAGQALFNFDVRWRPKGEEAGDGEEPA
ncbi:hypothetical protein JCM8547_009219 [Rhodosporidiobolus lusitaniae]